MADDRYERAQYEVGVTEELWRLIEKMGVAESAMTRQDKQRSKASNVTKDDPLTGHSRI
jgi:hypothetical protein